MAASLKDSVEETAVWRAVLGLGRFSLELWLTAEFEQEELGGFLVGVVAFKGAIATDDVLRHGATCSS